MTAITAKLADLRWALTAILPHSGNDETLAPLFGVGISADEGDARATVSATDRFTFVQASIPLAKPAASEFRAFLIPADVKTILTAHKTTARTAGTAAVDIDADEKRASLLTDTGSTTHGNALHVNPAVLGGFIAEFEKMFAADAGRHGDALFNVTYLARFEKAKVRPNDSILLKLGLTEAKPVRVTMGDADVNHLRGLIMPVRQPGES